MIDSTKKNRLSEVIAPLLVLAAVTALYALPLLRNLSYWGKPDWDQFTFWNAVPRETIMRYGQFPLWNPYSNGGNAMLAMPHSSFLSPLYAPVLIFGPVLGLKILWIACLFAGMLGMFFVATRLKLGPLSRYLPPLVFMLGSLYSLHLREGHLEWTALCLLPWAYLFSLKAREERKYFAFTVLALSMMILSGGVYVFSVMTAFLAFHALFDALREKKASPLLGLAGALVLVFLVCSVKLVPMLELMRESPRPTKDAGRLEPGLLPHVFLYRNQNGLYENRPVINEMLRMDWDRENWHEFGAYIGFIPLLLAFAGAYNHARRLWPLFGAGFACLWISMGRSAGVSLWEILHRLPIYGSLHVPSRFLMCVLFCVAVFAGLGCSEMEKSAKKPVHRWFLAGLLLFVCLDLLSVDRPILANAFTIPPVEAARGPEFAQGGVSFDSLLKAGSNSAMYPALLANRGTIKAYDIVGVTRGEVRGAEDPAYRGEAFLAGAKTRAAVVYFSPNKIVVSADSRVKDILALNQNYHRGWTVESDGATRPAISHEGLIAAPVEPGARTFTFRFRPGSFYLGLFLSALGILSLIPFLR